jgi:hypothetical protein
VLLEKLGLDSLTREAALWTMSSFAKVYGDRYRVDKMATAYLAECNQRFRPLDDPT